MTPLRALTLWPEWAFAIHYLGKRVENRTWKIPKDEWIMLHAGKQIGGRASELHNGLHALRYMAAQAVLDIVLARPHPQRVDHPVQPLHPHMHVGT